MHPDIFIPKHFEFGDIFVHHLAKKLTNLNSCRRTSNEYSLQDFRLEHFREKMLISFFNKNYLYAVNAEKSVEGMERTNPTRVDTAV